jgi:hypothetical protein
VRDNFILRRFTCWYSGGSYALFAGKEVARALGKMTLDPKDCTDDVDDFTPEQLKTLEGWEAKLKDKYPIVGKASSQSSSSPFCRCEVPGIQHMPKIALLANNPEYPCRKVYKLGLEVP